jgi:phenylalanyl-tRNA synthetase alpha chain
MESMIAKLHPLERTVLPVLSKETELSAIVKKSKLQEIEVMRALQWLENKNVLKINTEKKKVVLLDKNGQLYQKSGLPERKLLESLTNDFIELSKIAKKTKLSTEEINACIGVLKRKLGIDIQKDKELMLKLGPQGAKLIKEGSFEEQFLKKDFPIDLDDIQDIEKLAFDELKKRKGLLKIEEQRSTTIKLTPLGKKLSKIKLSGEVVNRLTPGMLKTGSWKGKSFRSYDVEINVPKVQRGKKHFVNEAVDYIKRIWMDLGFKEMTGNYVQSAFWDLDALFVPQDHPAREMQDTFYLEGKAKLPKLWEKVKKVHEDGGNTGSTGWQSSFSKEETEKVLLRTHTTVLSAQTISNLKKEDLPAKFFSVNKVFRNESLDWKHLFEFYQVEGIVIDPNANLSHLKGYLREFYKKMGYSKVRMRPAHFPYTEPSVEVDVYHPGKKQWVELGGAGIFRPEVVKPLLGFDCPVLAWGQGMGRIISEYWKIQDIRELYKNDLKQIREMKAWLK